MCNVMPYSSSGKENYASQAVHSLKVIAWIYIKNVRIISKEHKANDFLFSRIKIYIESEQERKKEKNKSFLSQVEHTEEKMF